jgi:nitroreductase
LDVFDAIANRRSVRAFTKQEVTTEEVEKLIQGARWAPSAGNIQPWEFILVRDGGIKHNLSDAAGNQAFIEEASVVIVVCANTLRSGQGYGSRGINLYCLQDTAAATQNIMLTAHALRLATCWVGAFDEEEARKVLKVPAGIRPAAMIPVGHPAEEPRTRSRRPLNEIIHHDTFGSR